MAKFHSQFVNKPPVYGLDLDGAEDRTKQSFKDECDINRIMAKYEVTGVLVDPILRTSRVAQFGDFTGIEDFQTAQNAIIAARDEFMHLPSKVRDRFNNNPAELLAFIGDSKNKAEAIELGLVERPPVVETPAPDKK